MSTNSKRKQKHYNPKDWEDRAIAYAKSLDAQPLSEHQLQTIEKMKKSGRDSESIAWILTSYPNHEGYVPYISRTIELLEEIKRLPYGRQKISRQIIAELRLGWSTIAIKNLTE